MFLIIAFSMFSLPLTRWTIWPESGPKSPENLFKTIFFNKRVDSDLTAPKQTLSKPFISNPLPLITIELEKEIPLSKGESLL